MMLDFICVWDTQHYLIVDAQGRYVLHGKAILHSFTILKLLAQDCLTVLCIRLQFILCLVMYCEALVAWK